MLKIILATILLLSSPAQAKKITLTTKNNVTYRGPVTQLSVMTVKMDLIHKVVQRGTKDYPLYLVIDSPGGLIYHGLAFIEFVKHIDNLHTITLFSASMAAAYVEHLPGTRYITDNGILMFHRASGGFEGQFEVGELESQLRFWKKIVRTMEQKSADRIGISLADYKSHARNEWWLYGEEAVNAGAADEVVDLVCSQKLVLKEEEVLIDRLFGTLTAYYSACPLMRFPLIKQEE